MTVEEKEPSIPKHTTLGGGKLEPAATREGGGKEVKKVDVFKNQMIKK